MELHTGTSAATDPFCYSPCAHGGRSLTELAKEHGLCRALLGLEKVKQGDP